MIVQINIYFFLLCFRVNALLVIPGSHNYGHNILVRLEGKYKCTSAPVLAIHKPEVAATEELLGEQNLGLKSN